MCLGIPGRVVEIVDGYADQLAVVDVEGARRTVNIGMLDAPPPVGHWVVVHLGFAMELIDAEAVGALMSPPDMVGPWEEAEPGDG